MSGAKGSKKGSLGQSKQHDILYVTLNHNMVAVGSTIEVGHTHKWPKVIER